MTTAKTLESLSAADAMIEAGKLAVETDQNWEMGTTTYTFADESRLQVSGAFVKSLRDDE
jgi:hypothetical protein